MFQFTVHLNIWRLTSFKTLIVIWWIAMVTWRLQQKLKPASICSSTLKLIGYRLLAARPIGYCFFNQLHRVIYWKPVVCLFRLGVGLCLKQKPIMKAIFASDSEYNNILRCYFILLVWYIYLTSAMDLEQGTHV